VVKNSGKFCGYNFYIAYINCINKNVNMTPPEKEKLSEILLIAGIAAFIYYRYSKLPPAEKMEIQNDIKETGRKVIKELVPKQAHGFLPAALK
jgi:hypothetical protein